MTTDKITAAENALAEARKAVAKKETVVQQRKRELLEAKMEERAIQRAKEYAEMITRHEEEDEFFVPNEEGSAYVLSVNETWQDSIELTISKWNQNEGSISLKRAAAVKLAKYLQEKFL